ncbi:MAG: hypothetical protein Q9216_003148 [Gyalolechia sp. 2 TL-2023]
MPSYTTVLATALALISATNAHMKLKTPAPYGAASLNNSPLDPSGSDFPCKQRSGVYDAPETKNVMPIGAPQTLSFIGSAVHGGGSCQISLTKDLKPTKDSKWMVIHSIEGGCPAAAEGNLGNDPAATNAGTFQYKIPQGISPGEYTLAWTWFNRIGNREMYMNCAPISVTGGNKRRDLHKPCNNATEMFNATKTYASDEIFKRDTTFPDMFKANIPATDCTTPDSKDIAFPNPGSSVDKKGSATNMGQPTGPKCGGSAGGNSNAAPAAGGSASGSSGSGSGSGAGSGSPSGAGGSPAGSAPASSMPAMPAMTSVVAIPPAGAPKAAAASVASAAQSVVQAAASVMTNASPAPTGSSSSGAAGAAGAASGSCTPGETVCSPDGTMFGVCNQGKAVFQPVAAGTSCKDGKIGFAKRSAKFARSFKA